MRFLLSLAFLAACDSRYPTGIGREDFIEEYAAVVCAHEQECAGDPNACDPEFFAEAIVVTFGEENCPDWDAQAAAACIDAADASTCDEPYDGQICAFCAS